MRYADTLGKSFLGGSSRNCQGHKARVCVWSYTGAREGREIGDESKKNSQEPRNVRPYSLF